MYRSCGFPGCDVRFGDCEIHHVIEWIRQRGPTDLDNLVPLCSRHHHTVHEGGWTLTLHPDRTITLRRPDGSIHTNESTVDVAPTGVRTEPTELQRSSRRRRAGDQPDEASRMSTPARAAASNRRSAPTATPTPFKSLFQQPGRSERPACGTEGVR